VRITEDLLVRALDIPEERAEKWAAPLDAACRHYDISAPVRIAAFLAQVGHESGRLRYVRELGGHAYLDKYDTGRLAERLGNTPEDDDDGQKYRGRGLIMVTGHDNYERAGLALGLPLLEHPELLEEPTYAAMSAAWYWSDHHLNDLADVGDMRSLTRLINGGYNGLEDRKQLYQQALQAVACPGCPALTGDI